MAMAPSHEMVKPTFFLFLPCSSFDNKFMWNFRKGRKELEIRLFFKDGKLCNDFHVGRKSRNAVYSLTSCVDNLLLCVYVCGFFFPLYFIIHNFGLNTQPFFSALVRKDVNQAGFNLQVYALTKATKNVRKEYVFL